jgi:acyl-CoA thioester hydrolase
LPRIDRERLDRATFPVVTTIPTRFDDIDSQGHVNNAAAAVILQEARVDLNFQAQVALARGGLSNMVASLCIEYAGEMRHPLPVEVSSGILALGRSSVIVGQLARQAGRPTLYAETVLVVVGPDGPTPMPDALRAAYEDLIIRPR